jgi:hypothetical protein
VLRYQMRRGAASPRRGNALLILSLVKLPLSAGVVAGVVAAIEVGLIVRVVINVAGSDCVGWVRTTAAKATAEPPTCCGVYRSQP